MCDPEAGFTVRRVVVWPGLRVDGSTYLGAIGTNPYSKKDIFGQAMPKGSGIVCAFVWSLSSKSLDAYERSYLNAFASNLVKTNCHGRKLPLHKPTTHLPTHPLARKPSTNASSHGRHLGETASFWRSANKGSNGGLFASVQTSFFESGVGHGALRWANKRWG